LPLFVVPKFNTTDRGFDEVFQPFTAYAISVGSVLWYVFCVHLETITDSGLQLSDIG
jgi:hypothetical protein